MKLHVACSTMLITREHLYIQLLQRGKVKHVLTPSGIKDEKIKAFSLVAFLCDLRFPVSLWKEKMIKMCACQSWNAVIHFVQVLH